MLRQMKREEDVEVAKLEIGCGAVWLAIIGVIIHSLIFGY